MKICEGLELDPATFHARVDGIRHLAPPARKLHEEKLTPDSLIAYLKKNPKEKVDVMRLASFKLRPQKVTAMLTKMVKQGQLVAKPTPSGKGFYYSLKEAGEKWSGFGRIGGKLTGSMPAGFKVVKAGGTFKDHEVGLDYVAKSAKMGTVTYLPKKGKGFRRGMDRDDVLSAMRKKTIEPYGEYGR